jgi:hypothetical protein
MGLPPPPQFDVDTVRTHEIMEKMPRHMLVAMSREELARLKATVRAMVRSNRGGMLIDWSAGEDLPAGSFVRRGHDGRVFVYDQHGGIITASV